jgi:hypothetical protein
MSEIEIKIMSILDNIIVAVRLATAGDIKNRYEGLCIRNFSSKLCQSCAKYYVCSQLNKARQGLEQIKKEGLNVG